VPRVRDPRWQGVLLVVFLGVGTLASFFAGLALDRHQLSAALAAAAFAVIAFVIAPGSPVSIIGWVGWGIAGLWMAAAGAIGRGWTASQAQHAAEQAARRAKSDAFWAEMKERHAREEAARARGESPPAPASAPAAEPEHWIFRSDPGRDDDSAARSRDSWDRQRRSERWRGGGSSRGSGSGGSSSGSSGGATGRW
jgi:uncharacterized membrane protein YgcG